MTNNNPNYFIMDLASIHNQHPTVFKVPTHEEIQELQVDDVVKLCFINFKTSIDNLMHTERLWVRVHTINEDGTMLGVINQTPFVIDNLFKGTMVTFEPKHVGDIYKSTNL